MKFRVTGGCRCGKCGGLRREPQPTVASATVRRLAEQINTSPVLRAELRAAFGVPEVDAPQDLSAILVARRSPSSPAEPTTIVIANPLRAAAESGTVPSPDFNAAVRAARSH
jgi:hypothetical protein